MEREYELDWPGFIDALEGAANDPELLSIGHWLGGWKDAFYKIDVSEDSKRLVQMLEQPYFSMLNEELFHCSNGAASVNPGILAKWLATRTRKVGARETIAGLRRLIDTKEKPELDILLLSGIEIEREYLIDSDFKFVPLSEIWKYSIDHFQEYLSSLHKYLKAEIPTAAIIKVRQTPAVTEPSGEDNELRRRDLNSQDLFWLALGLVCPDESPTPIGRWKLLPSWVPFSGMLDAGFTTAIEMKHPKGVCSIGDEEVLHAAALYRKLKNFPAETLKPFTICLSRLNQSVNTWDLVERAIDLGVALESILTPSESTDQLSFQFRLYGALLVAQGLDERLWAYDIFKSFYTLRSKAVHNGELPLKGFSIFGGKKLTPREVLTEATSLGRRSAIRLIERGGMPKEDYAKFLLSGGEVLQNQAKD